jgi:hypothetical protein
MDVGYSEMYIPYPQYALNLSRDVPLIDEVLPKSYLARDFCLKRKCLSMGQHTVLVLRATWDDLGRPIYTFASEKEFKVIKDVCPAHVNAIHQDWVEWVGWYENVAIKLSLRRSPQWEWRLTTRGASQFDISEPLYTI